MDGLTLEERRILIGNFYNENKDKGKSYTVHHFRRMNVPKRTIYRIIKRVENHSHIDPELVGQRSKCRNVG